MLRTRQTLAGTLGSQVTRMIGRQIVSGKLAPGKALPAEPELCRTLGVSRTTLREAVKTLHAKGLVTVGPKNGTRVLPHANWNQLDVDVLAWRIENGIDRDFVDQLYELRAWFEPQACALAAVHGTPAEHDAIAESYARMLAHRDAIAVVSQADVDFHFAIIAATHNMFFTSLGSAVRAALHFAFERGPARAGFPPDELKLHGQICAAILARRVDESARLMRKLIAASHASLTAWLGWRARGRPAHRKQ